MNAASDCCDFVVHIKKEDEEEEKEEGRGLVRSACPRKIPSLTQNRILASASEVYSPENVQSPTSDVVSVTECSVI